MLFVAPVRYCEIMKLTADSEGRIRSPELFPPGTSFESQIDSAGQILLKPLLPQQPKRIQGKLVHRAGKLVMQSPQEVTADAIAEAVRSERNSRA